MIILYNNVVGASVTPADNGNFTLLVRGDVDGMGVTTTLSPEAVLELGESIAAAVDLQRMRRARDVAQQTISAIIDGMRSNAH